MFKGETINTFKVDTFNVDTFDTLKVETFHTSEVDLLKGNQYKVDPFKVNIRQRLTLVNVQHSSTFNTRQTFVVNFK